MKHGRGEGVGASARCPGGRPVGVLVSAVRMGAVGIILAALTLSGVTPAAIARTYSPRPPGGGLIQNPDGTYSLWGEGGNNPIRTYSPTEAARMAKEDEALLFQAGETGQDAGEFIEGLGAKERTASEELRSRLATGQEYASPAEATVGNDVVAQDEAAGLLERAPTMLARLGDLAAAGATLYAGLQIGNALDRTFGLPELFPENNNSFTSSKRMNYSWGPYRLAEASGHALNESCEERGLIGTPGKCLVVEVEYQSLTEQFNEGSHVWEPHGSFGPSFVAGSESKPGPECPKSGPNPQVKRLKLSGPVKVYCVQTAEGVSKFLIKDSELKDLQFPANKHEGLTWGPHGETHEGREERVTGPERGTTVTPPAPATVPPPVTTYILHERESEFPGVNEEGETETEKEQEEHAVPTPFEIEIPHPEKSELGTHYVTRLHELGFTDVVEAILPAANEDPRVGPNEVAYTSPAEGSQVRADSTVIVEVNPGDAPVPDESGSGGFGSGLPDLKLPKFGAICTNFPFGVPCWLIGEFAAWSSTASTPIFTIEAVKIHGATIGPASVNLSSLEPIMTKVRPFMILFSTIGLVLLFYNFARGGGPPSGGQGDGGGDTTETHYDGPNEYRVS